MPKLNNPAYYAKLFLKIHFIFIDFSIVSILQFDHFKFDCICRSFQKIIRFDHCCGFESLLSLKQKYNKIIKRIIISTPTMKRFSLLLLSVPVVSSFINSPLSLLIMGSLVTFSIWIFIGATPSYIFFKSLFPSSILLDIWMSLLWTLLYINLQVSRLILLRYYWYLWFQYDFFFSAEKFCINWWYSWQHHNNTTWI